jgi:Lrp/AsnC family transcriptional regulator, leucine-responsive regulatory protein
MELDKLDRDILNILQQDATLPLKELAEKVHSSVATCQRRIQLLTEKRGYYQASGGGIAKGRG